jgi:hypothetical protein
MAAGLRWGNEMDIERVVETPSDVKERAPARVTVQQRMRRTYNGLRFFADRAAKKWPLRGSLKLG